MLEIGERVFFPALALTGTIINRREVDVVGEMFPRHEYVVTWDFGQGQSAWIKQSWLERLDDYLECAHLNTVNETSGNLSFAGEVDDDIREVTTCLDCKRQWTD